MRDYNIDYCKNCNSTVDDLTLDGEDVKLTYYQGLLLCQDCIFDAEEKDDNYGQENE